jgi:hypothetical protein
MFIVLVGQRVRDGEHTKFKQVGTQLDPLARISRIELIQDFNSDQLGGCTSKIKSFAAILRTFLVEVSSPP